jgi:NAD(P)-dependent dehydrogenase (short-subunit alcohol dehydrogenase family)
MASIVILGATGGIGSALARQLHAAGQPLHLIARTPARLEALATELGASFAVADMQDGASIKAAVEAGASPDGIAGLAYCVGSIVLKSLKAASAVDYTTAFTLNAQGAALAVQAAEAGLRQAKGSVVLFSSVAVGQGFTNHTVIAAAKGAVEGLTRALAAELAPDVRVNAIAPSLTRTPLAEMLTKNPTMANAIAALHPLPRLGEAEDSASLAAFLLSPQAGWITGQIIGVDGGRSSLRVKG